MRCATILIAIGPKVKGGSGCVSDRNYMARTMLAGGLPEMLY